MDIFFGDETTTTRAPTLNVGSTIFDLFETTTTTAATDENDYSGDIIQDNCHQLTRIAECLRSRSNTDICRSKWQMGVCMKGVALGETGQAECAFNYVRQPNGEIMDDGHVGYIREYCNETSGDWSGTRHQTCVIDLVNVTRSPSSIQPLLATKEEIEFERQQQLILRIYNAMKMMTSAGYALSLTSLVVAILLFAFFRRLHCMRVTIHINLMISYLLRTVLWYLHYPAANDNSSAIFEEILIPEQTYRDLERINQVYADYCVPKSFSWCRFHTVFMHYIIIANYFWILIEGVYLWILLQSFSLPTNKTMIVFVVFGWLFPWIPVSLHTMQVGRGSSAFSGDCWDVEDCQSSLFWIIKAPIVASLMINFVFFVMVLRMVASKLRFASLPQRNQHGTTGSNKLRLMKSTLSLIPLLGISYLLTTFVQCGQYSSRLFIVIKLVEVFYISIQGFLIAVIYCFLNSEIREEVKKLRRSWKLKQELGKMRSAQRRSLKASRHHHSCDVTNVTSMSEHDQHHVIINLQPIATRKHKSRLMSMGTCTNRDDTLATPPMTSHKHFRSSLTSKQQTRPNSVI